MMTGFRHRSFPLLSVEHVFQDRPGLTKAQRASLSESLASVPGVTESTFGILAYAYLEAFLTHAV